MPVFRIDDKGDLISPAGTVIATADQQLAPGVFSANLEFINLIFHWGMREAAYEDVVKRAKERGQLEELRAWIETDEPIEPPFPAKRCGYIVNNYTDEICGEDLPCTRHK